MTEPNWTPPINPAQPAQPQPYYVPSPPPKKRHTVRNVLLIAVAAFVALCGVGTIVAAATSSGKTGNAAAITHTSSAKPAASPTGAVAAPATPAQLTVAQQMQAWLNQGGQDRLTALSNAMGEVQRTSQAGDIQGAKQAALGLGVAVKAAQSYAPLPDPTAQKYWASALSHFGKCAQSMYVGLAATDSGSLTDAITEMDAGTEQLRLTTQRINKLQG